MNTKLFDYLLPKEMIAQYPERDRELSRLLVLNRSTKEVEHKHFKDITGYFRKGDVLVLNDSKVLPARLTARKDTGGSIDILLLESIDHKRWRCLANGIKKGRDLLTISVGGVEAVLTRNEAFWTIDFLYDGDVYDIIREHGKMPLPPYIKRNNDGALDFERYQTVYAEILGSIAAPTAGFHFTKELLDSIEALGVAIFKITLHIGIGTFFLVKSQNVEDHVMHREYYRIVPDVKKYIENAKADGRRIIACGTSVVRTLETAWMKNGDTPVAGHTELFIYPGYRFKMIDAMITNFHLPRSTPLLLVSAFTGSDELMKCYKEAIDRSYRFYSYGDAMLVI
jgi:S-adenosylmethionine:tRNA ribosyltransferase-isomerase